MSWFSELSKTQRTAIVGASAGWAVDGFDFVLYSFVIPTLIASWGMSRSQAGLIATGALLTSSLGGWIAGTLADVYGRVKVLQLTILWFSACTFLSGLTNSFPQLALIRGLQGFGFGGEWAVGAVLVAEMMEAKHRGKAIGVMQSSYAVGWALATAAFALLFSVLPGDLAWRMLFFVGLPPALLVVCLLARVSEPPVFLADRAAKQADKTSWLAIFAPEMLPTVALASLLAIGIQGAYYAVVTWLPTYLSSVRHLSVLNTGGYLLILVAGSFLGYLLGAASMDRYGRRRTLIGFALLSALTSCLYFSAKLPAVLLLFAGFPLGFTVSGMIGGLGAFLAELFPTRLRGSAQGFAYNFGRAIAASFPPLIGFFSGSYSLPTMMALFALGSFACVIAAAALLPETLGRSLETVGTDQRG
jgi:MFS family permease